VELHRRALHGTRRGPRGRRLAVTHLTRLNEQPRENRWSVDDASERFIEQQLRAIVGVEFSIEKVEGKAKLSQNRSEEDHAGVVEGLRREGGSREHEVADLMQAPQEGTTG